MQLYSKYVIEFLKTQQIQMCCFQVVLLGISVGGCCVIVFTREGHDVI